MRPKDPHVERLEAQVQEWEAKIESLVARGETAGEHVREDYRRRVAELRAQGAEAKERLEAFKAAGVETWEAFRTGIDAVWKDLDTALREIRPEDAVPKPPHPAASHKPSAPRAGPHPVVPKPPARHRGAKR